MTLPSRLVSLLLVHCFVLACAAPSTAAGRSSSHEVRAEETLTTGILDRTYNFFSTFFSSRANSSDDKSDQEAGLKFRLSEAPEQPEARATNKIAQASVLSDAETQAILNRLPLIKPDTRDEVDFALRDKSLPPPRTGATVMQPFPAALETAPPDQKLGPLEVVRQSPEGDVPIAPNLSVTFSQPMVAVTSQEEAAETVPVRLSPQPPGKWHWIGTRTLLFEPDIRFPMATQYSVTVPAGTKSANGGVLGQAKSWTFTTPPPTVKNFYPEKTNVQRRDVLMFAEFDQRIDPKSVLGNLKVIAGTAQVPTRLATKDEIDADENVRDLVKNAGKDRWLAFRAIDANGSTTNALPAGASVNVTIPAGTPSAEGSRTTKEPQNFPFMTFAPLRVERSYCFYNLYAPCLPEYTWQIQFNNPLDAETLSESQIRVEPAIDQLKVSVGGNTVRIDGLKKPNTKYRVTIDRSLRDKFGQTLEKNETVEFKVDAARSLIGLSGQGLVVLDPAGPRQLSLYSVNYQTVKVSLYAVEPEDWSKFQTYRRTIYNRNPNDRTAKQAQLPGRLVSATQLDLKQSPNDMIETAIDLSPALKDGFGHVIVSVESITPVSDIYHGPLLAWVQSTQIGLDAFVDNDELIGWANSLTDGSPLNNVQMQIMPASVSGITGADGLVHLPLKASTDSAPGILVARRGNDVAILPEDANNWWATNGSWQRKPQTDELRWYVFDDRKLYRPGEELHVKGWIRRLGKGKGGDVGSLDGAIKSINYVVKDSQSNDVGKGEVMPNALGGFDFAYKLPPNMNLGTGQIKFQTDGTLKPSDNEGWFHNFEVQEFRRPEFEVTAKLESEGPLFVGDHADVSVAANYFAGGGLQNAEVKWEVRSRPTNFTPPNRDDYTFGKWSPWWGNSSNNSDENNEDELAGRTDSSGKHRLRIDFDSVKPARPSTVIAEASVQDVNRQTWDSAATMLVHPANLYVGLKSERIFVQQGEPLVVQAIVTDLDGRSVASREVKMRAVLLDWKQVKGQWKQVEVNPQDCVVQSAADAVKCRFTSKDGGTYRVRATIHDDRGRANETEMTLWVAGGKRPPRNGVEEEKVELIPDHKEYKSGDTAQILVQAPFYPAEAVMTLRRSGIVKTERFRIDSPTYTLRIPIEEAWTPNVHVQVDLVGAEDRAAASDNANTGSAGVSPAAFSASQTPVRADALNAGGAPALPVRRPAYASGEINLSIPPLSRKLSVTATPRDKTLEPGNNTLINVEAKDASGTAVTDSEIAVVVVDESVLALTNYKLDDPISIFYADRDKDTNDFHSRQNVRLAPVRAIDGSNDYSVNASRATMAETVMVTSRQITDLPVNGRNFQSLALLKPGLANVVTKSGTNEPSIRLRENFNALAVFAPAVHTDANGRAQVQVKLPDNLTRYRVMAVAVAGGRQFGAGESTITARLPLMARPSAPRFLNFGDRFELPIVLQNQTDNAMTVDIAVRATNASFTDRLEPGLVPAGGTRAASKRQELNITGRRVTVAANDRVEVRIPATTTKAGTARFQIGAVSGRWSDAAEVELPVWTPATTEAFATYGEIDKGAISQPVKAPANVFPQFGGLEIETSSTQLQELTDAVIYLTSYPYECSEQLASRVITIAALRDVLTAFKAKDLPSAPAMEAAVTRDLKRLQGMQNQDGGFGFWKRGNESWPYLSIHVAHALARAKQKKFDVPKETFEKSQKYLREIESHIPSFYGIDARRAIIAYSLYVRAQMGDRDPTRARKLIAEAGVEKLSLESVGWLLSVLSNDKDSTTEVAAIRHLLNNRVTETAGMAHFVCAYSDGDYLVLNSNRRADGVILEALIGDQPNSDLIPKIVRGLLAHRTRGRWENTQENVFILLALDRYFNTFEKVTPNFIARAWLGSATAGEQQFRGRSTDRQQINVPMHYLVQQAGTQNLVINKNGVGRLYYRIGMNYAPSELNLKPVDYGFTVERSYESVDNPTDVSRDSDGTWRIKAGARVRVRLTMVATSRRYHVALVDPLPAGFEALNPSLATTGAIPRDEKQTSVTEYGSRSFGYGWWWLRPEWFEHQNLRDDRVEAFTSLLWEGVYKYSYVARATTPGQFIVPPAKAEEMYHPETFGRGKTDRVRVE
ncbi:MAG TPA: Ig-like domain-containing protein [Pyrinomonadaceae bacterium]